MKNEKIINRIWNVVKKTNFIFIDIINFLLLMPVYFAGVGLSKLIWTIFYKKKEGKNYWIKSKKLPKNLKKWEELM